MCIVYNIVWKEPLAVLIAELLVISKKQTVCYVDLTVCYVDLTVCYVDLTVCYVDLTVFLLI